MTKQQAPMKHWNKTTTRPEPGKHIIILCDDGNVTRGYMNAHIFDGEENPTYSFHGRYYDFQKHQIVYCLVNAIAWMPMPTMPERAAFLETKASK